MTNAEIAADKIRTLVSKYVCKDDIDDMFRTMSFAAIIQSAMDAEVKELKAEVGEKDKRIIKQRGQIERHRTEIGTKRFKLEEQEAEIVKILEKIGIVGTSEVQHKPTNEENHEN